MNFHISDACDDIILDEVKNVDNLQILKMTEFYHIVITTESLCPCFKERQLQATSQFYFHEKNILTRTRRTCIHVTMKRLYRKKIVDINYMYMYVSLVTNEKRIYIAMLSSECFCGKVMSIIK